MTKLLVLLFLATPLCAAPALDDLFSDYAGDDVPGASVTVIRDGAVVAQKGFGMADLEHGVSVMPETNFRLASLTKQFTAMAVLQLVEAGKLHFDDSLTKLFPGFPAYGSRITVRHLLNHTSGLKDYEDLIPSSQSEQVHDRDVLQLYEEERSGDFRPGTRYRYCNGGYVLLGLVVERASGESFASYLKHHVFEPIGMKNTVALENGISTVTSRAYGYSRRGFTFVKTDQSTTSATLGDGGVYTSVDELYHWDQALYSSALVGKSLLDQAFLPGKLENGDETSYGFGWMLGRYRGERRVYHTGSSIGFRTAIVRFPEKRFTVAVLVNREGTSPWDIADEIADRYLFGLTAERAPAARGSS